MKLKIQEEAPGELFQRAQDAVRTIERITGQELLKAADECDLEYWQLLYVEPNPDGSRKLCVNCPMWVKDHDRCTIHGTREVTSKMVCGYHVYGKPLDKPHEAANLDPKLSGLEEAPAGGTSCDRCRYFDSRGEVITGDGACRLLRGKVVKAKGCCAAWDAPDLKKADDLVDEQITQTPAQFEYSVLKEAAERSAKQVARIRNVMNAKIGKVLTG